jgi:hypothetical protein
LSHLKSLFDGAISKNQAWDAIRLHLLKQHHEEIFGKLSKDLEVSMVRNGVVELTCNNPMWVNEIRRLKNMLLEKMNKLLEKNGRLLDIKVIFDSENPVNTPKNKGIEKPLTEKIDFAEKIRLENQKKIQNGMKLCKRCQEIYTEAECCVFCRTTL